MPPKKTKARTTKGRAGKTAARKGRKGKAALAARAVRRSGRRAGKVAGGSAERVAREALTAIKVAGEAIEAALPHSGDPTEEE